MGEAQAAKELCESIAFVVNKLSQQDREKVMRFVADRQLICGSGTVNNLQEIYKIVSGQSQSIAVLIAEAKREIIHNIIATAYKKNSFAPTFNFNAGMEIHHVPRIANAIKDEYGLTEESDHYSRNLNPSRYKPSLLKLVNEQLNADAIISGVVNRILLNLPSDDSESFKEGILQAPFMTVAKAPPMKPEQVDAYHTQQTQQLLETVKPSAQVDPLLAYTAHAPTDTKTPIVKDPQILAYREAQQKKFEATQQPQQTK